MPTWVWIVVGIGIVVGVWLFRHLIWIPNRSDLNDIDELPHLRETAERLATSSRHVSIREETANKL